MQGRRAQDHTNAKNDAASAWPAHVCHAEQSGARKQDAAIGRNPIGVAEIMENNKPRSVQIQLKDGAKTKSSAIRSRSEESTAGNHHRRFRIAAVGVGKTMKIGKTGAVGVELEDCAKSGNPTGVSRAIERGAGNRQTAVRAGAIGHCEIVQNSEGRAVRIEAEDYAGAETPAFGSSSKQRVPVGGQAALRIGAISVAEIMGERILADGGKIHQNGKAAAIGIDFENRAVAGRASTKCRSVKSAVRQQESGVRSRAVGAFKLMKSVHSAAIRGDSEDRSFVTGAAAKGRAIKHGTGQHQGAVGFASVGAAIKTVNGGKPMPDGVDLEHCALLGRAASGGCSIQDAVRPEQSTERIGPIRPAIERVESFEGQRRHSAPERRRPRPARRSKAVVP